MNLWLLVFISFIFGLFGLMGSERLKKVSSGVYVWCSILLCIIYVLWYLVD